MAPLLIIVGSAIAVAAITFFFKHKLRPASEKTPMDPNFTNGTKSVQTCGYRLDSEYILCDEHIKQFRESGLTVLPNLLSQEELLSIEVIYDTYMREGSPDIQGRDFCDMSKSFSTPRANYSVINAMLPRKYYPQLKDNIYERVTASISRQLFPDTKMILDYDQLLDKMPGAADAVFAWHQDMAYWPNPSMTPDTRTVTFSLALDTTSILNGCIRYISGSGVTKELRPHVPLGLDRSEAHAIVAEVGEHEQVSFAEVPRGSASIHDEYVVHGSGGNLSDGPRRTYVIAYRTSDTVQMERLAGFTHSHNDVVNWDVFNNWKPSKIQLERESDCQTGSQRSSQSQIDCSPKSQVEYGFNSQIDSDTKS